MKSIASQRQIRWEGPWEAGVSPYLRDWMNAPLPPYLKFWIWWFPGLGYIHIINCPCFFFCVSSGQNLFLRRYWYKFYHRNSIRCDSLSWNRPYKRRTHTTPEGLLPYDHVITSRPVTCVLVPPCESRPTANPIWPKETMMLRVGSDLI